MGREQRRAAGEIDDEIAVRSRAVLRGRPGQFIARGRKRCGVVVDQELERPEMALGRTDCALDHGKFGDAARGDVAGLGKQHRDVELVLDEVRRLDRAFVAAIDEDDAFAGERHQRRLGQRFGGHGKQRRHLRARGGGILRPAGGFADIGEGERRLGCRFGGDFGEQRRFLGAAHRQRRTGSERCAKAIELGPAEMVRGLDIGPAQAALERVRVERHRLLAGTGEDGALGIGHEPSKARVPALALVQAWSSGPASYSHKR